MNTWHHTTLTLLTALLFSTAALAHPPHPTFSSGEHVDIGNRIQLRFDADNPPQSSALHMPNGLVITFGDAISLGDFYGILGQSISLGMDLTERKERFLAAFASFTASSDTIAETTKILDVVYAEQKAVTEGLKNGEQLETIYAHISDDNNRQWNCITGGGCGFAWFLQPGRYLLLAEENFDHFGNHAWLAYEAGHEAAIAQALIARETQNRAQLELAYAMDGFASHFLTDRFAAGHIRTPREALHNHVVPSLLGDLLANLMHDEENQLGLHVHNEAQEAWTAYGDHFYYAPQHAEATMQLDRILQASVNQIFVAYRDGVKSDSKEIAALLPQPNEQNSAGHSDLSPLFYWDEAEQKLYRRLDVRNPYDYHWTTQWSSWTTLLQILQQKPLPEIDQARLARSPYAGEAGKRGILVATGLHG